LIRADFDEIYISENILKMKNNQAIASQTRALFVFYFLSYLFKCLQLRLNCYYYTNPLTHNCQDTRW